MYNYAGESHSVSGQQKQIKWLFKTSYTSKRENNLPKGKTLQNVHNFLSLISSKVSEY